MASNVTEFDEDSDLELEEEDLFPVVPPKAVEAYKKLKNCFFKGRYIGQIKWKAAFAFKRAENKKVSELFSLIDDLIDREENRVWTGFTIDYDFCTIYAPAECGLLPFEKYEDMTFQIKETEVFNYAPSYKKYDVGAKIWIVKSECELTANFKRLECMKFRASGHCIKTDEFGEPCNVYRVDDNCLRNRQVISVFNDIEEVWKKEGKKVCKSFREKCDGNPLLIWERLDEDYDDGEDDDDTEEYDSDEDDMEDDEEEGDEDDDEEGVGNKDELKPKENASTGDKDKGNENRTQGNSDPETDPPDGKSSDAKSQRNQTKGSEAGGSGTGKEEEEKTKSNNVPTLYDKGKLFSINRVVFRECQSEQFSWKVCFSIGASEEDDDDDYYDEMEEEED